MGVKGAFTSAGFDTSSIKRFGDQLAHISVYYEYRDQGVTQMPATISDKYVSNFKNIFDLYINDATIPKTQLASATMDDANSELHWVRPCSCRMALGLFADSRSRGRR